VLRRGKEEQRGSREKSLRGDSKKTLDKEDREREREKSERGGGGKLARENRWQKERRRSEGIKRGLKESMEKKMWKRVRTFKTGSDDRDEKNSEEMKVPNIKKREGVDDGQRKRKKTVEKRRMTR